MSRRYYGFNLTQLSIENPFIKRTHAAFIKRIDAPAIKKNKQPANNELNNSSIL